jgi:prepilin-type N-terminal cleavage/methylation domain-containing protein
LDIEQPMNNRKQTIRQEARQGFTLIEVLLVMVLLAIITAFSWPAVRKTFANRRLQTAADAVRTQWCQARVQAMQSGHTYAFRYAVGSDHFCLEPQDQPNSSVSSTNGGVGSSTSGDSGLGGPNEDALLPREERALPEGIKFLADDSAGGDPTASPVDQQTVASGDASDGWSDAILFYPDGTTSNAQLMLSGEGPSAIRLILRGITGTVTVSDTTPLVE